MKENYKAMKHQLTGINLVVESISRKGIFDCDMAYSCENCGKTIVNYANVTDGKRANNIFKILIQ